MSERVFLSAEWRDLVMLNYAVDPALLRPHLPPGVELDTWGGTTYVSAVGFMFLKARVLGCAIPWHRNFEELNLRYYVRRRGRPGEPHVSADGFKRGVGFLKEIVPRAAVALVARRLYGERYESWPMRHERKDTHDGAALAYEVRAPGRWGGIGLRVVGEPAPLRPGSEEEFIAEHYWGYVARPGRPTLEYRVEHPPWRAWSGLDARNDLDLATLYGPEFAAALSGPPRSAFVAEGSAITVHHGEPLTEPE